MNNLRYIILCFFCAICAMAQLNPQSKKITEKYFPDETSIQNVTPALQKDKGFTDYEELILFINNLKEKHNNLVTISYIGETQKGKNIPLVKITKQESKQEKIKVWMQGGLHGNEPASTEGLLYFMYELLNNPEYNYLLDKIELAIVPMANIDGYLKNNRNAANGLDLNRDQTKLMAPESVLLKEAFSSFNAEVGVDFHEYNPYRKDFTKLSSFGITSAYDIMFLYSGNLNVAKNLRNITDSLFVENARTILNTNKLSHHDYISTEDYHGEIQFNQGSNSARSSATSYALSNTISTLIEVRGVNLGRTSLKRRINTAFLIAMSYLKTAYENINYVKKEIAIAQNEFKKVTVTSAKDVYKDAIKVIDLDSDNLVDLEVTIRDALKSKPKLVRNVPLAYLIQLDQKDIISKLKTLGISVEIIEEDREIDVEAYKIITFESDTVLYENMKIQNVETQILNKSIRFPKGTYKIVTYQKNAPLLAEVLEPEAPNSFISFGVLKTELHQELPIYRIPNKN
jgi:hypothetical protein